MLFNFFVFELNSDNSNKLSFSKVMRGFFFYVLISFWKFGLFVKLTFGWWDEELINLYDVKRRCQLIDLDPTDDDTQEEKMLAVLGETRSICWQLLGLTLVAKFGEAVSEAPVFVWADKRGKVDGKPVNGKKAWFYDRDDDGNLAFSYFSLPLRCSNEAQRHCMRMGTPRS